MDYYDKAVAYLTEWTSEIECAWDNPCDHVAGGLFNRVSRNPRSFGCGCLTQIRGGSYQACRHDLTEDIRNDERIPSDVSEIGIDNLPVFAEWQRRIDAELSRTPPIWIDP